MKTASANRRIINESPPLAFNPYAVPAFSTRTGPIFRLHPYPTKINYQGIIPFILAHTKPGDLVYDGFAGTCSTGLATAACTEPDYELLKHLDAGIREHTSWGPRRAICIDIGVLPTFIGRTLLKPIDISTFEIMFNRIMDELERDWGWIYEALDDKGMNGIIRQTVLSDIIRCPNCNVQSKFLDMFVDFEKGDFKDEGVCPNCDKSISAKNAPRVTETIYDDLLNTERLVVKREPVTLYGVTGKRRWSRPVNETDLAVIKKISETSFPPCAKAIPMLSGEPRWGDMYRAGYHQDITFAHHFYTRRNYLVLSLLYDACSKLPEEFRDHYLLLVSSYNVAHSSLMTRFVFKRGSNKPVNTSAQPAALYISGCPVEKNVFHGVRQKMKELRDAVMKIQKWNPRVEVYARAAQNSGLPANSVDYIFTDPPFGGNIQYSEINFLSEIWLGAFTNNKYETIMSKSQKKTLTDYERLLTDAFCENFRILKPGRYMTVVFHSTKREIWNALHNSIVNAGFEIINSSVLIKDQASFKQTLTSGAVKRDAIIFARKPVNNNRSISSFLSSYQTPAEFLRNRLSILSEDEINERTFDFLFSRYAGMCLASGKVSAGAKEFKRILDSVAEEKDGLWFLRDDEK